MDASEVRGESVFDTTINAVIIYDRFEFAVKASGMLRRATEQTAHWVIRPWRLDILDMPAAAEVALDEAAGAHLILLAMRQVQSFEDWLLAWLERWARSRRVPEAALAVWDGGITGISSAGAPPELVKFAERHGLSLIRNEQGLTQTPEVSCTPAIRRIIDPPWDEPPPHWGIKE